MSLRAATNFALFIASFVASAAGIAKLCPLPDPYHLRPKFEYFSQHCDDYDVVFVGSSRVLRGFDPAAFDTRIRELGGSSRSFNFGIPGMRGHEAERVIEMILDLHPKNLRHLLVEFPEFRATFPDDDWANSERAVWWHDLRNTLSVLGSVIRDDDSPSERARLGLHHLRLMLAALLNYGSIDSVLERWVASRAKEDRFVAELLGRDGFARYSDATAPKNEIERRHADPSSLIMEEFAPRIGLRNTREALSPTYNVSALERQIDRITRDGIELRYVTIPCSEATPDAYRCAERGLLPGFLPLNDPERYPAMWKTRFYSDGTHMKESGAREFSRLLAEAFLAKSGD